MCFVFLYFLIRLNFYHVCIFVFLCFLCIFVFVYVCIFVFFWYFLFLNFFYFYNLYFLLLFFSSWYFSAFSIIFPSVGRECYPAIISVFLTVCIFAFVFPFGTLYFSALSIFSRQLVGNASGIMLPRSRHLHPSTLLQPTTKSLCSIFFQPELWMANFLSVLFCF